jgi:3-oxoacyl-(acyl-carrier-protein) synthase
MTPFSCQIAITGSSAITSAGIGIAALVEAVLADRSTLSPVPEDVAGNNPGLLWGRANHFKASDFIPPLKARKFDRASQFAVSAVGMATEEAGFKKGDIPAERIGIALGCGFGGISNSAEFLTGYFQNGTAGLAPMLFPNTVANAAASNASIEYGFKGPNITFIQRFCSAESAILAACRFLEEGRADIMLAGGVDDLSPLMLQGFVATGQNRRYAAAFGEGCGVLVLERYEHAVSRGARIKAVLESIDTVGMILPDSEQLAAEKLIQPGAEYDYLTLSGADDCADQFLPYLGAKESFRPGRLIGKSLAMGGTVLGLLVHILKPGKRGIHLAASPEGPYFSIVVRGDQSV